MRTYTITEEEMKKEIDELEELMLFQTLEVIENFDNLSDIKFKYEICLIAYLLYLCEYVFETIIPRNVRLSEAPSYGETILDYAPTSRGGLAYQALASEILREDS